MKQQTFATAADQSAGFERYRKPTRRDEFLATMNAIVPWPALCEVIAPHYAKGVGGRPPIGLERMLRIHFIQHWFNLADEACEEALYDSASLRRFVGIDLGREPVPDATTMLKFRRLLNEHKLGEQLFAQVGEILQQGGAANKELQWLTSRASPNRTGTGRSPNVFGVPCMYVQVSWQPSIVPLDHLATLTSADRRAGTTDETRTARRHCGNRAHCAGPERESRVCKWRGALSLENQVPNRPWKRVKSANVVPREAHTAYLDAGSSDGRNQDATARTE